MADKLNFAKDWEEAPAPEAPVEKPPEPKPEEFIREIDLGDGSGKQVFKGATYQELIDKLADAQVHATRKIQELSKQSRREIKPEQRSSDYQELRPTPIDASDDQKQLFRKMFQAEVGITPQEFLARENQRLKMEAEAQAQNHFVRKFANEYTPTPDNAQKIYRFLEAQNLPVSKANLEYAFQELRQELAGKASAVEAAPTASTPEAPRAAPVEEVKKGIPPPPSFVRPSVGAKGEMATEGGIDAAEFARIAQLPPAEMKARIESMFRQQRSGR